VSGPYISGFGAIGLSDRPSVGGKGASLGELLRAGLPVPAGFVVTTRAFIEFMRTADPQGESARLIEAADATDLDALSQAAAAARRRVLSSSMATTLQEVVRSAYRELRGDDSSMTVAVRSSAIGEDSAEASFAGLQETFLWVRDEESTLRLLLECWASLYSTESVSYRRKLALPESGIAMAVVVQRMVQSRSSGVMFTRSPVTGDRSVIALEGSWGLGSCIVSGEVTPDKFTISKVTGQVVARTVSAKSLQHVPDLEAGGIRAEPVPEERRSQSCLTDEEIARLAQLAQAIEQHYGSPQDIEWAIDARDGRLYVLQSRPETAWSKREATPAATPKAHAFDHVLGALTGRKQ
jgi:pyruvate, water dikinase